MAELFSNLAESTTVGAINNTTDPVTFTLRTGDGTKFPAAAVGSTDYFHAVVDTGTDTEILRCQRSGDSITADRAQEGTLKVAHVLGVKFSHVLTASSIQQILAYIQSSTLTTQGDLLTRSATAPTRVSVGANGTVLTSNGTSPVWATPSGGGGGTGAAWQLPAFTIYFDGTNYSARNERTQTVDYTSNTSLHNVFNSAATALGTGTTYTGEGGLIALAMPTGRIMTTTAPCVLQNQMTVLGPGRGLTVRASGSSWNGGTINAPNAVFDAYLKSRVKIEGVRIDCAGISGTTGIIFEKGTGATGGNSAHSYFLFNEVTGFDVTGIQIGHGNSSGATSTAWLLGNQITNDVANGNSAVGVGFYVGDCHYGWGNNIKLGGSASTCMVIAANSVHVLNGGHMVNNGSSTKALISVRGGNPFRIEGIYFDNLGTCPAVSVNVDGSGNSNRGLIANNWLHFTGNADNTISGFMLNAANGNCYGTVVSNNVMEADTVTTRAKSIIDIANSGSNPIQNSLTMIGNSAQNCVKFITADNGYVDGSATATSFVGKNMNHIEDSQASGAGGAGGGSIRVGPA